MDAIICWDGDHIGRQVGRAVLDDNIEEVRRVDQAINAGNDLWRSFALRVGGSVIEIGGDEGRIMVGAQHLSDMPAVARQYADTVGATVSVGVGMKLSEAAKALLVAKLRGGNQITIWDPDMQTEIDQASQPKTEQDKLSEEYLQKAQKQAFREAGFRHKATGSVVGTGPFHDPDQLPGGEEQLGQYEAGFIDHANQFYTRDEATRLLHARKPVQSEQILARAEGGLTDKDQHTGFTGTSTGSKVKGTQGDHEEGAESQKTFDDAAENAPGAPEATHAADDFEEQLHDLAQQQGHQDGQAAQQQESHLDEVKNRVVETLMMVRQQMPIIQQLQQTAPEVYSSFIALTQGLMQLGREVMGPGRSAEATGESSAAPSGQPVEKAEDLEKSVAQIRPGQRSIAGPGRLSFDYSHALPEQQRQAGLSMKVTHVAAAAPVDEHTVTTLHHGGKVVGSVTSYVRGKGPSKGIEPHSMLLPKFQGQGLGQAMYEAAYGHAKNALGISRVEGGPHSEQAHALHQRLAQKHGFEYQAQAHPHLKDTDYPFEPYSYAIKDEVAPLAEDEYIIGPRKGVTFLRDEIQKDETLDKAASGAQGGAQAGRQHLDLPAGTIHNGQVKVAHADGKTGWKHVTSGMIAGQEADAPTIGENTHPVSSRAPGSK